MSQRLLDHLKPERVQRLKQPNVIERVAAVAVNVHFELRKGATHLTDDGEFPAPTELQLHPREPGLHSVVYREQKIVDRIHHPEVGANRHYRSEEHTSELQSLRHLVCRLL